MKLARVLSWLLICWMFAMQGTQAASHAVPPANPSYGNAPVVTPDIPHLPWTMENGVKVFHLTAEIVNREIMPKTDMQPAKSIYLWGYSGSSPGPTIEVNEGDRVRIIFHNKLPEDTTVHWHGLEIPINMDGMPYISQPPVKPGGSFTYEFHLHQNGTFFYHSHGAMQEMAGMIGLFIIHPKKPHYPPVQKDFGLVLQEFAVLQNNPIPNSMAMEFNWLTINGKAAPSTTPLIVRQGDRVRIRMINIGMDHHPIHLHGNQFYVTGTEGGRIPQSAWFPGNTIIIGVAQSRDIEFDAVYAGDWMLHCHLPHHMMNNMVSMVGPMAHIGQGMHTGAGMEEGMGIVRQGSALDDDLGPAMGRGMGNTADREQPTSHSIGHPTGNGAPGASAERTANLALRQDKNSLKGPGYPQDDMMMMPVDAAVAKPHNNYLNPGWSAALQGMMNLVRVLPAAEYDKLQRDIRSGYIDPAQFQKMPGMDHGAMPGMDHSKMQQGQQAPMDHSKMQQGQQAPMDHSKMQQGQQAPMDHSKMQQGQQAPMNHSKMQQGQPASMDHSKMQRGQPASMDHSKMQQGQPGSMDHSKMQHGQPASMDHSKMQHGSVRKQVPMDHSKMKQGSVGKEAPLDQMDHRNMPGMDHSKMKHRPSVEEQKKPKQTTKPAAQRAALEAQAEASRKQMEASRKQMEASRKQIEAVSGSDRRGKQRQAGKEENKPSVDHSMMGH